MLKTVREVLDKQRKDIPPEIETALQDFLKLTEAERLEFLFLGLMFSVRDTEWLKTVVSQLKE